MADDVSLILADLQRRIHDLETMNSLQHSSVRAEDDRQVPVGPTLASVNTALEQALADTVGTAAADGLVTIWYTADTPPAPNEDGDLWSVTATELRRYSGETGEWEDFTSTALADALARAQNTADNKTQTFWSETSPALSDTPAPSQGDIWFQTAPPVAGMAPVVINMWRWDEDLWVQLPLGTVITPDYTESSTGAMVAQNTAQFQTLNVIEALGASTVNADTLNLAGDDLAALVDALPRGVENRFGRSYSGINTAEISTSRVITHQLNAGSLKTGRIYRVVVHGHYVGTASGQAIDGMVLYTIDGTTPTTTSPVLDGSVIRLTNGAFTGGYFQMHCMYLPQNDYENTKFAWSMNRVGGTGTFHLILDDGNRGFEYWIEDCGASDATYLSGNNGKLSQRSKEQTTLPPPDPDPVTDYVRDYYATWTRSYDDDGGTRNGDDGPDLYQGYISGTHGDTRSLFGFDYAQIQADLAGATVTGCSVKFKVRHSWDSSVRIYVSSHDYTAKPATWDGTRVNEDRANLGGCGEGSSYTLTLGTGVGNEFKSGTTKGLGFGPTPTNDAPAYYAYMYGGTSSYRPRLRIRYTK